MLHRGKITLLDFTDEALRDEAVLKTAQKVRYTISDKTGFPEVGFPGWVNLRLKDGRTFEHRLPTNLLGIPGYERAAEEVISKFEDNASMVLPSDQVARLRDLIMNIEQVSDMEEISACLRLCR